MDSAIILAAGKGTRMKSALPKVLHEVLDRSMLQCVLDALQPLDLDAIVVVVGHGSQAVKSSVLDNTVFFVDQHEQLGTGHAVAVTEDFFASRPGTVLILCGDTPLIQAQTLSRFLSAHKSNQAFVTVMTAHMANPYGYGRIISDDSGNCIAIAEEKDATPQEKQITEVNCGIYCIETDFLFPSLRQIRPDNNQNEFYLPDIVKIAVSQQIPVFKHLCEDAAETFGVNCPEDLTMVQDILRKRKYDSAGIS